MAFEETRKLTLYLNGEPATSRFPVFCAKEHKGNPPFPYSPIFFFTKATTSSVSAAKSMAPELVSKIMA